MILHGDLEREVASLLTHTSSFVHGGQVVAYAAQGDLLPWLCVGRGGPGGKIIV